ncbi:hypothetical protein C7M84_016353 [Penaeus vannamei]|uniref:Ig-like domain-containing protein n=1 Tax=Penaeus vannamei TaxID=6689 RepID=A0A423SN96_PENVA|nr:hypothetical protein C7M84_016353 [Penaeus vannamei]
MKSRAGLGSVKMTAWLATVLCCWDWALADYDFPWLTADGAPPTFRINTSEYDFAHAIGRPGKSEEEAAEGPRLLSRSWQRLVVSRGSSITLNCSVADPGDVSVTWTRNKEVLTVDRYSDVEATMKCLVLAIVLAMVSRGTCSSYLPPVQGAGSCPPNFSVIFATFPVGQAPRLCQRNADCRGGRICCPDAATPDSYCLFPVAGGGNPFG